MFQKGIQGWYIYLQILYKSTKSGQMVIFHKPRGFSEIRGFSLLNHHLGAQVVWGRYNLTFSSARGNPPCPAWRSRGQCQCSMRSWKRCLPCNAQHLSSIGTTLIIAGTIASPPHCVGESWTSPSAASPSALSLQSPICREAMKSKAGCQRHQRTRQPCVPQWNDQPPTRSAEWYGTL